MIEYLSQRRLTALAACLVLIAVLVAGLFALWPGRRASRVSHAPAPRSAGPSLNGDVRPGSGTDPRAGRRAGRSASPRSRPFHSKQTRATAERVGGLGAFRPWAVGC